MMNSKLQSGEQDMKSFIVSLVALSAISTYAQSNSKKPLIISCAIERDFTILNLFSEKTMFIDVVAKGETKQLALSNLKDEVCSHMFSFKNCADNNFRVLKTPSVRSRDDVDDVRSHNRREVNRITANYATCENQRER
jgi:hypothetical protein